MNEKVLFDTIKKTVEEIERELIELNGKGIYFAPEQHIAFCIGKAIMKNRTEIFGTDEVEWLREKKLGEKKLGIGQGGVTDIVFNVSDKSIALELKLRDTEPYYKADVEKLISLPDNIDKYFCVLLDSYSDDNDKRITHIQNEYNDILKSIGHHSFETWNNWYKKQVYCNLNLFSISKTLKTL